MARELESHWQERARLHWQLEGSLPVRGPHMGGSYRDTVTGVTQAGHDRLVGSFRFCQWPSRCDRPGQVRFTSSYYSAEVEDLGRVINLT